MKPIDQKKQARIVVSERLTTFFDYLRQQLATSTDQFCKRVESKLSSDKQEK